MPENQILKLNLTMSPRAIDELKNFSTLKGVSKYELPLIMFPEEEAFEIKAAVNDGQQILLCFNINGRTVTLCGRLDSNNFFCTSVNNNQIQGKRFTLYFQQEKSEDFTYINENVKKRLSVWNDYIESLMKKAEAGSYVFFCKGACVNDGKIDIVTYDLKEGTDVRSLTVGFVDESRRPSWGFGSAERLDGDILTVRPFSDNVIGVMKELSAGIRLIAYDGAADITCKRMKSGIDKLCKGEAVNKRLPEFIFEPKKANRSMGENVVLDSENLLSENMNSEQITAVEGALNAEDLYLIQGPPGTGKTTVIAEICYQNAIRGLKTLIVSQSNLAVDNAISRVMNHADIRVLRKGDTSRVEEEGLPFVEDNVVGTWISCIARESASMDADITQRMERLKQNRARLPEILSYAENALNLQKEKLELESQLYFYKSVFEDAKRRRSDFFELIAKAYETDDIEYAEKARDIYPPDFIIPNDIYNDILRRYHDIKADSQLLHQYEYELDFLNEYTERFLEHFNYICKKVGSRIMDKTVYEGVFYYADFNMVESLYNEGCAILESEPQGVKALVFGFKWRRLAALYFRRAENLMMSIQLKTVRLCERIYKIKNDVEFIENVQSYHISLDALGENFENQYYGCKAKGEKLYKEFTDISGEYNYAVEYLKEKIADDFYAKALKNIDLSDISLEQIEYNVNKYYQVRYTRYDKWKRLLYEWRRKISDSSGQSFNALKNLYIKNANVIGITCIQSGTKDFNENYPSFDVVIIDEASKSTPPDIILPMLKGKKIILVGDHKQLPPFIDSNAYDEISEEDTTLRELIKVSLFEELYEKSEPVMRTMLFRQYRMHRDIAALINQFYINTDAGRLESPASEYKKHCCQGIEISEDNHVLWYDIPDSEEYRENKKSSSYYNVYEAETIKKILCVLEKNLSDNNCRKSVGVITFYDAQVKLLEDEIINSGFCGRFGHFTLRIGSVDRFQGMEEDIIIVSFVRNNPEHLIGFARDSRRINVAMSRARELLIITGCSQNFIKSSNPESSRMFYNIYDITKKLGGIRNSGEIPDIKLEDRGYSPCKSDMVKSSGQYNDTEVSSDENINILDYFILKAAGEFKEQHLSLKNISNALGIAPVFVENRINHLKRENLLEYRNKLVKITPNGENTITALTNDYSM
ncbi:MAG: hypothetical protein E7508_00305 [Ruminococcus sp.]|nr:hypothetical protein [Ruminococcus sp.]